MTTTYQGWTNYETWCVALWIDNDPILHAAARSMSERHADPHVFAEALDEWISELAPDLGASMWSDLLNAALSEVNWYEIAKTIQSEV